MLHFKKLLLFLTFVFFISSAFGQGFEKLTEDQVDQNKVKLAKKFTDRYFSAARDGKTCELQDIASDLLIQGFPPEVQKKVFEDITTYYGNYKSLEYVEAWKYTKGEPVTIIRFKGIFSIKEKIPEIRVVMDEANKVAGFWYKPWEDELK